MNNCETCLHINPVDIGDYICTNRLIQYNKLMPRNIRQQIPRNIGLAKETECEMWESVDD